jgi:hypothetical protein
VQDQLSPHLRPRAFPRNIPPKWEGRSSACPVSFERVNNASPPGLRVVWLNTDYLSVGQAGNQIGTAFWENILLVSLVVPICRFADPDTDSDSARGDCVADGVMRSELMRIVGTWSR